MVVTDGTRRVTGDLTPDSTGDYLPGRTHAGKPYYVRKDGAYKIWFQFVNKWFISTDLDVEAPGNWKRLSVFVDGDYDPQGTYAGIATVTEI